MSADHGPFRIYLSPTALGYQAELYHRDYKGIPSILLIKTFWARTRDRALRKAERFADRVASEEQADEDTILYHPGADTRWEAVAEAAREAAEQAVAREGHLRLVFTRKQTSW